MVLSILVGGSSAVAQEVPEPAVVEPSPETRARGSFGVGLAFVRDVGDRATPGATVGPGLSLVAPMRVSVSPAASLRISPRIDAAVGGGTRGPGTLCASLDHLSWQVTPDDGESAGLRTSAAPPCGWLLTAGATVGPEVRWPVEGAVQPTFGVGVGLLGVLNVNRVDRGELTVADPESTRIDAWSLTAAWLTEVNLGVLVGRERHWFAEVGYAAAWVPRASARRTVEALDVAREPYGYNAVRLSTGIVWSLRPRTNPGVSALSTGDPRLR